YTIIISTLPPGILISPAGISVVGIGFFIVTVCIIGVFIAVKGLVGILVRVGGTDTQAKVKAIFSIKISTQASPIIIYITRNISSVGCRVYIYIVGLVNIIGVVIGIRTLNRPHRQDT